MKRFAQHARQKKWWIAAPLAALLALVLLSAWLRQGPAPLLPLDVRITVAIQPASAPVFVALDQNLFERRGLRANVQRFELGAQGLRAVIEGRAEFAIVADTPIMFQILNGEPIAILSAISNSRRAAAIVGRRDRGIEAMRDLAGKKIGVTMGTNMQFFLDAMLSASTLSEKSATIVNLRPDQIVQALADGEVDAVVAWHPYLGSLQQKMGDKAAYLFGDDLFGYRFNLVARQDYLRSHPEQARRVLAALLDAHSFIDEHSERARSILGEAIGMPAAMLATMFDASDFELRLDQSLVLALDDQARWAIRKGLVKAAKVPNFLDYLYYDALESVQPNAVTVIR